jgi:NAD(P)-dependent dehydrogenase (short-subunit alcohol dehydrogenase family)
MLEGAIVAMELGLKGRCAAITGGSRGIGKAIAKGLASEGVNLVLMARNKEPLDKAADEITKASGVRILAVPADITTAESVQAAAAAAKRQFDAIHIVVNNAGGPIRRMDRQITWPDADWLDDVNLKSIGMLRVVQAFLPHIPRDGSGRIINISGVAGNMVWSPALTHGFNNAAMNQVTSYLALDLAGEHITVNAVVPGIVGTEAREVWAENMARQQATTKAEFLAAFCKRMGVLSDRWATMEEVSDAVLFLASDRARYVNGSRFFVDAGLSINARPA